MQFIEKLYSEISAEGRKPKSDKRTTAIFIFNHNISRALMLPTLQYGPESDDDWAHSDSLFLRQAAIIQILTSLESYYHFVFTEIVKGLKTSEVDSKALSAFIKGNKLLVEFASAMARQGTLDFNLCELLPKYYPLQEKEKIKLSFNLLGVDPIGCFDQEWARTFGDNSDSTASLRHTFVHNGSIHSWEPQQNEIQNRIKDALVLANQLDREIANKFYGKFTKLVFSI